MSMIQEKAVDFKSLEQEIYRKCCETGREILKNMLETYDAALCISRDKAKYRHKGARKSVIKTIMGEVEYSRTVYETTSDDGGKCFVYLLDEAMGMSGRGFFSGLLSEIIVKASCESPYREAARSVSELTGQSISHTAVWNIVQDLGERIDEREQALSTLAAKNQGRGEIESKVLFEEMDGIWLNLQGKDRKKTVSGGREMKLSIAYDGWVKTGKNRYNLTNKVACASFESIGKFRRRKEGVIADMYNVDEVDVRVLGGDGASWIKKSDFDTIYQLDTFHRNRAIAQAAPDENSRVEMRKLLYSQRIDELLTYIDALANSVADEEVEEKLRDLHTYFANNSDGLIAYNQRGIELPKPPNGKEYRTLGAMESNVFSIIGNRMKGRRACWSIAGGNNLAKLLCLKSTKKLSQTLKNLTRTNLPEKYADEILLPLTPIKVGNSVGKGWNGFCKGSVHSSQKWLKDLVSIKSFSELSLN